MRLRPARFDDADLLLEWRNHPDVRRQFFHTDVVERDAHVDWLRGVLESNRHRLFVAEIDGIPVGTARLDLEDGRAEISVTVAPGRWGTGIGSTLIALAVRKMDVPVDAWVRAANQASIAAFRKAGFRACGPADREGVDVIHLTTS